MFNKQLKQNIVEAETRICKCYEELDNAKDNEERYQIMGRAKDLAELRDKLSETKTRESLTPVITQVAQVVVPGVVGLAAILMVLNHEKENVITTKAMTFVTKLFRGF